MFTHWVIGAQASKEYLRILELAAKESEAQVEEALRLLLEADQAVTAECVRQAMTVARPAGVTDVEVAALDLRAFDVLCGEVLQ